MQNLKIINRKGLSQVVSIIMITLISILALALVGIVILKLVKSPQASPEYNCLQSNLKQIIEVESACYNQDTNDIQVKLKRSIQDMNINSINFVVNNEISSEQFECGNQCGPCQIISQGNTNTYYISSELTPKEISIQVNGCLLSTRKIIDC